MFKEIFEAKKTYTIKRSGDGKTKTETGTVEELLSAYSYVLEVGQGFAFEPGNKKVNTNPKTIKALLKSLTVAADNTKNGEEFKLV